MWKSNRAEQSARYSTAALLSTESGPNTRRSGIACPALRRPQRPRNAAETVPKQAHPASEMEVGTILRDILVVLISAQVAAELSPRRGIPTVVGEILAGFHYPPRPRGSRDEFGLPFRSFSREKGKGGP